MNNKANHDYAKLVSRAAKFSFAVSVLLASIKLFAWSTSGSISIFASFSDSVLDISASLTNLIIIKFALQPADKDHNFGHGKLEPLVSLIQVVIIVGSALFVLGSSFSRLYNNTQPQYTHTGLIIIIISTVITAFLVWYQIQVIKKTDSQAIKADSMHYKGDLLANVSVIVALVSVYFSIFWMDIVVALAITSVMILSAKSIAFEAIDTLMDKNLPEDEIALVEQTVNSHPKVLGMHDLRSRKSGNTRFIQLHLELPDDMLLSEAHDISEDIEKQLIKKLHGADVIIHLDPESVVGKEQHNLNK